MKKARHLFLLSSTQQRSILPKDPKSRKLGKISRFAMPSDAEAVVSTTMSTLEFRMCVWTFAETLRNKAIVLRYFFPFALAAKNAAIAACGSPVV